MMSILYSETRTYTHNDSDGIPYLIETYTYDINKNLTGYSRYETGKVNTDKIYSWTYDTNNKLTSQSFYSHQNGIPQEIYTYNYQ